MTNDTFSLADEAAVDAALAGTATIDAGNGIMVEVKEPKKPVAKKAAPKAKKAEPKAEPKVEPKAKPAAPKAKAKDQPKAKATGKKVVAVKVVKAPAKKPAAKKAPAKKDGPRDDARFVASHSERFNTDQIRILRAVAGHKGKMPMTRAELKVAVGMKPESLYSAAWLNNLWELQGKRLIRIEDSTKYNHEIRPQHVHSITDLGREALAKAEAAAKAAAKAK